MRYLLIDRFEELERGKRARAVKCVTLGEPFLRELPHYPPPLVLEALLQTGGWLTRLSHGIEQRSVLGKVESATFPALAHAGDRIEMEVSIVLSRPEGTLCEGVATVDGGREVGRARFLIVFVPPESAPPIPEEVLARGADLLKALRIPMEDA
jgi:3-hydroxyacyl-[acyl-carrier-protein] dehydratase